MLPGSLRRYHGDHGCHRHDHAQLLFGVGGGLDIDAEGRGALVDAASGLVIPAGMDHGSQSRHGAAVWVVDLPPRAGLDRLRRLALPPDWARAPDLDTLLDGLAVAPRRLVRRRLDVDAIHRQVGQALHEPWPTARLAALAALSPQRFHARWLERTGLTPQAWLRARRLDEAVRLLRGGRGLAQAAERLGYARASALATALRRERGLGARDLRRG